MRQKERQRDRKKDRETERNRERERVRDKIDRERVCVRESERKHKNTEIEMIKQQPKKREAPTIVVLY